MKSAIIILAIIISVAAELSVPRYNSCNVYINNTFYIIGGYDAEHNPIEYLEIIYLNDSRSETFDTKIKFEFLTCAAVSDTIYVLGTVNNTTQIYTLNNTVLESTNIISNIKSINNQIIDNIMYLIFPQVAGNVINSIIAIDLIDLSINSYSFAEANVGASIVIDKDIIYMAGGVQQVVTIYNMTSGTTDTKLIGKYFDGVHIYIYNNKVNIISNEVNADGSDLGNIFTSYVVYEIDLATVTAIGSITRVNQFSVVDFEESVVVYDQKSIIKYNTSVFVGVTLNNTLVSGYSRPFKIGQNFYMFGGIGPTGLSDQVWLCDKNIVCNQVLFVNDGFVVPSTISPTIPGTPLDSITPEEPVLEDNTVVIAAVTVVGSVVIIGIALTIFFIRRKKRQHKNIKGDVKFIKEIGAGSYGKVYLAKWQNTEVAVKVSKSNSEDFEEEASLMINLPAHPNIVQVLGVTKDHQTGDRLLVLEYCDGGSLDHLLYDTNEYMNQAKQIQLVKMIARGMLHLHNNKIIHRDLSSRNILLHGGAAKISDFGMARVVGQSAVGHTKTDIGPIRWMSPESLRNNTYSYSSDVWSFGIVIYEILAREEPHLAVDQMQIGLMIRDQGLRPTAPVGSNPKLCNIMERCLSIDPTHRPGFQLICDELDL